MFILRIKWGSYAIKRPSYHIPGKNNKNRFFHGEFVMRISSKFGSRLVQKNSTEMVFFLSIYVIGTVQLINGNPCYAHVSYVIN